MTRLDWVLSLIIAASIFVGADIFQVRVTKTMTFLIMFSCIVIFSGACAAAWWAKILNMTAFAKKPLDALIISFAIKNQCSLLSFFSPQRRGLEKDCVQNSADLGVKLASRIPNVIGIAIVATWFLYLLISDQNFRSGRGLFGSALSIPIVFVLTHGIFTYFAIWALSFFFLVQLAKLKGDQK